MHSAIDVQNNRCMCVILHWFKTIRTIGTGITWDQTKNGQFLISCEAVRCEAAGRIIYIGSVSSVTQKRKGSCLSLVPLTVS